MPCASARTAGRERRGRFARGLGVSRLHSAGPAPVANGTNACNRTTLRIVHGSDDEDHARGEDREVACRFPPRSPHRMRATRKATIKKPTVGWMSATESDHRATQASRRPTSGLRSSRPGAVRASSRATSVMNTVSNWSVAVVAIRFGYTATIAAASEPDALRRRLDRPRRNTKKIVSVPNNAWMYSIVRTRSLVGNWCVPYGPRDGRDEERIARRIERRRLRRQRYLVISYPGGVLRCRRAGLCSRRPRAIVSPWSRYASGSLVNRGCAPRARPMRRAPRRPRPGLTSSVARTRREPRLCHHTSAGRACGVSHSALRP